MSNIKPKKSSNPKSISRDNKKTWVIKLGSGGICAPFCEERGIVALGWQMVNSQLINTASKEILWDHVAKVCEFYNGDRRKISQGMGQLYRFGQECKVNDYILYYDPPNKAVNVCRVTSAALYRDFDLTNDVDCWHYRKVEYPVKPVPILDFHGSLKGSLLGPRMSFWEMKNGKIGDSPKRGRIKTEGSRHQ